MKHPSAVIQVFCKAPVLGEVKTRLRSALSDKEILVFYEQMLRDAIARLTSHDLCASELWIAGGESHGFFDEFKVQRFPQPPGDLGERMRHALEVGLKNSSNVILVGCDVPTIDEEYLDNALGLLDSHDVVLGPAEDGGYGLVGVSGSVPDVFQSISWGSDQVLDQTCARLNALRLNYSLLPYVWDVDTPEDLKRYRQWLAS